MKPTRHMMIMSLLLTPVLVSCGKKPELTPSRQKSVHSVQLPLFKHKRIQELFVVVFEKNYSPEEWKLIFDQTNLLSANKKKLRMIEGQDSEDVSILRSKLIQENSEILIRLGNQSLFMMNWSSQDENCKFTGKDEIRLTCKPRNTDNPLNGGLPTANTPVEWIIPNPAVSDIKSPYLKVKMQKNADEKSPLHYGLELRLKSESFTEDYSWFKGEAIPSTGSRFPKSDGSISETFFPFGYSEMTLTP